jgi:UDP-glucose 4-epimerase
MVTTKTVLITGATGFVGRATVAALADTDWQVIQGVRESMTPLAQGTVHLNLADPATILALAKEPRCDAIIHLGAHIGWSEADESKMFALNVLSTGCLAHLAHLWRARLIYASSVSVHGTRNETIKLNSPICTDTAYANSKWLGEQLIEASRVNNCILRIAGVFGYEGPVHLGLNRAIDGALKGQAPLQIGTATALRNYIYVKNVAEAIVFALEEKLDGIHLLAGHEILPIRSMLQEICEIFTPESLPLTKEGETAMNQVIEPSPALPETSSFREALLDIRKESRQ